MLLQAEKVCPLPARPRSRRRASSFPGGGVMLPRQRSRAQVERAIVAAAKHRDDATRHLDFDAYQHLTEQLDDLLDELRALPPRRGSR